MFRTYKIRLYPTQIQQMVLNKYFNCYYYLNNLWIKNKKIYEGDIYKFENDVINKYKYLLSDEKNMLHNIIINIKKTSNYKLAKKSSKLKIEVDNIHFNNKLVIISNLGSIKYRGYILANEISNLKIIKKAYLIKDIDRYYLNITVKENSKDGNSFQSIVGVDIGIKNLLTLSNGVTYPNNLYIKKYLNRIRLYNKKLSLKKYKSQNYYKQLVKLKKIYKKLSSSRTYYVNKVVNELVKEFDIIVCEKLSIKKMNQSSKQYIYDATFYEIIKKIKTKCEKTGKIFLQVEKNFPSSQICSICGNKNLEYKNLSKRIYECEKCKNTQDRDLNASINIMNKGLEIYLKKYGRSYQNLCLQ